MCPYWEDVYKEEMGDVYIIPHLFYFLTTVAIAIAVTVTTIDCSPTIGTIPAVPTVRTVGTVQSGKIRPQCCGEVRPVIELKSSGSDCRRHDLPSKRTSSLGRFRGDVVLNDFLSTGFEFGIDGVANRYHNVS